MDKKAKVAAALTGLGAVGGLIYAFTRPKKEEIPPVPPPPGEGGATIGITILDAQGNPVPQNSPAALLEGQIYTVMLTITNTTTKAGQPWATPLQVSIFAGTNLSTFIPSQIASYNFGAGEIKILTFPLGIPVGTGGETGQVVARVFSPIDVGLTSPLATDIEPITIGTIAIIYGATIVIGV